MDNILNVLDMHLDSGIRGVSHEKGYHMVKLEGIWHWSLENNTSTFVHTL